ncbi:MAG: PLDc N-terminal domain-containing protein [Mycobacteriales bacterium]
MLYADGLGFLAELCLLVYCLLDVLRTPAQQVRNLPKPIWLLLCLLPPVIGPICWLLFGRPPFVPGAGRPAQRNRGIPPEYDRPGRAVPQNPDDDAAFLQGLRDRAEAQRRLAAERARERRRPEGEAPPSS